MLDEEAEAIRKYFAADIEEARLSNFQVRALTSRGDTGRYIIFAQREDGTVAETEFEITGHSKEASRSGWYDAIAEEVRSAIARLALPNAQAALIHRVGELLRCVKQNDHISALRLLEDILVELLDVAQHKGEIAHKVGFEWRLTGERTVFVETDGQRHYRQVPHPLPPMIQIDGVEYRLHVDADDYCEYVSTHAVRFTNPDAFFHYGVNVALADARPLAMGSVDFLNLMERVEEGMARKYDATTPHKGQ